MSAAAIAGLAVSDSDGQRFGDAQLGVAQADIARIGQGVDSYIFGNGKLPASLKNVTEGGEAPLDPWGHPYAYRAEGSFEYVIWSFGPNGVDEKGDGDDVTRPRSPHPCAMCGWPQASVGPRLRPYRPSAQLEME